VAKCPRDVRHDGRDHAWTGKIGQRISDPRIWVIELEADDCSRIWVDAAGRIYPD